MAIDWDNDPSLAYIKQLPPEQAARERQAVRESDRKDKMIGAAGAAAIILFVCLMLWIAS